MKMGSELIMAERSRQMVEEGYKDEDDDKLDDCELALAAGCYVINAACNMAPIALIGFDADIVFPFHPRYWKPRTVFAKDNQIDEYIRDLVRAGALIAAEIDRVQRIKG